MLKKLLLSLIGLAFAILPAHAHAQTNVQNQVLNLLSEARAQAGCAPLSLNPALNAAAQRHTVRMANANTLSHQLPGEAKLGARFTAAGYKNWRGIAENVAAGQPTAEQVVAGWLNSPGHRANILQCAYQDVGIGFVSAPRTRYTFWWTTNFGVR